MAEKTVFILNPRSAAGATLRRFERVRPRFEQRLPGMEVWLTERPGHATKLARRAIDEGASAIIAVGGDGTSNEVINGFFDEKGEPLGAETAFGVVTSGTGGDFRRTFGWATDPLDDLRRIERRSLRRIDVGRVRFRDHESKDAVRCFVNIGSFGMSGQIVDTVNRSSKALGAKASFLSGTLKHMIGYRPQRVRLAFDEGAAEEVEVTVVALANGQYFGGGMWVAPEAVVDDGLFDAVVIEGGGLPLWLRHGLKIYAGRHRDLPQVRMRTCKRVVVEPARAGERVLLELDGEQPGALPATFEVVPRAIPLLC